MKINSDEMHNYPVGNFKAHSRKTELVAAGAFTSLSTRMHELKHAPSTYLVLKN